MQVKNEDKHYTCLVSESFADEKKKESYEVACRRWLVRELDAGRITVADAIERFNFNPANAADSLIRKWRKKYASDIILSLPVMTEKERQKLEALQKQLKALEKQLEEDRKSTRL